MNRGIEQALAARAARSGLRMVFVYHPGGWVASWRNGPRRHAWCGTLAEMFAIACGRRPWSEGGAR